MAERDHTVDDLESLPEEARYELVDGELIPLDPTTLHQLIVIRAVEALRVGCPRICWRSMAFRWRSTARTSRARMRSSFDLIM
jgi:hypothetical protein